MALCNKQTPHLCTKAIMALLLLQFLQEAWIPILSCFSIFLLLFPYLVHLFPFLAIIKTKQSSKPKLPPSPPKLPIIGHLHLLGDLPYRSLYTLSHKYGPLLFLQLGNIPTLVVSSAETAREVLKTHDLTFSGRHVPVAAERISYNCSDVTFAPYGPYWRQARKICILELLSSKRVQSFGFVREHVIGHMIDTISSSCTSSIGLIDLTENLRYLTNTLLCTVAFGKIYSVGGDGKDGFAELIEESLALMASCFVGDYFPSMGWLNVLTGQQARSKKNFREIDDLLEKVIQDHLDPNRDEPEHEDLVDVLLRLRKDSNLDIPLTMDHIKGILMDMYTAGSDTTSVTLEWAMAELVRNPRVMKKAQREVREIVEKKGKLEESDVYQLKYLKSVVKEALRLHPPGPLMVPRECREECVINGYYIPKKSRVFVNVWAIGRDPNCWENPEEFRPERFDDESVDFKGQDFQFLPFGSGRRGCPGIHFATAASELVLAHLLHNFDWELPTGMSKEELDMPETYGLVHHMKYPLRLIATPYQPRPSCV